MPTPQEARANRESGSRAVLWAELFAFVAWALLVAALTLSPNWDVRVRGMSSSCLLCGELGGADLIRNILMFMPAGVFLLRRGWSVIKGVGLGLLLSAAVEVTQYFVPGRHTSLRDVVVNGLGVGVGALFYLAMRHGVLRRSRAMLIATMAFPLLTVAATGWLLVPQGTPGIYYAQWVPERPYYAPWGGRLLDASVGGRHTPIGRLRDSDQVRALLDAGATVSLRFMRGQATTSLTAIYVVMDDEQREILMIGANGNDLVVRPRIRAVALRLDQPDTRFPEFFAQWNAADTVQLVVQTDSRGRVCVGAGDAPVASQCAARPSIGAGWGIILWKDSASVTLKRALDGVAVALMLLPLAMMTMRRGRWAPAAFVLLTATAMALLGRAMGLAWIGGPEALAVLLVAGASALVSPVLAVRLPELLK